MKDLSDSQILIVTHAAGDHAAQAIDLLKVSNATYFGPRDVGIKAARAGIPAARIFNMVPGVRFSFLDIRIKALWANHQIMAVGPADLQRTITRYNEDCAQAFDTEFKRKPETLLPIDTPPFYVMECVMGIINTQGGPRRNAKSQVMGALSGRPIPRLYAAGEFGFLWNMLYAGGTNLSECIVSGLIASRNAMAETPRT